MSKINHSPFPKYQTFANAVYAMRDMGDTIMAKEIEDNYMHNRRFKYSYLAFMIRAIELFLIKSVQNKNRYIAEIDEVKKESGVRIRVYDKMIEVMDSRIKGMAESHEDLVNIKNFIDDSKKIDLSKR